MKRSFLVCMMGCLVSLSFAQVELKTDMDSTSYAIGRDIGSNLKKQGLEFDPELVKAGLADALAGDGVLSDQQVQEVLQALSEKMRAKQQALKDAVIQEERERGQKFLTENGKKDSVITTESGLQYKILREGEGEPPTADQSVEVHYEGRLIDGKVFDSSYERGEPIVFGVTQVIKGWTEALQLMKPGAKYQIYIPSELAYGSRGAGADIPPGATLIFDVELLSIQ